MSKESSKYVRIDVAGKDESLWKQLRPKLIQAITNLLDTEIDPIRHSTVKEEGEKFISALLDYGKGKLNKPGIDNDKTLAEIEEIYSKKQRNLAEVRKINAEAESIELSNKIKKLKVVLEVSKVVIAGDKGAEAALFLKDVDHFLQSLNVMEGNSSVQD